VKVLTAASCWQAAAGCRRRGPVAGWVVGGAGPRWPGRGRITVAVLRWPHGGCHHANARIV